MKYLFVYPNVKEYDILENSITEDVSIFQTSTIELDSIINDVTHIGFMYHTQEKFPFQVEQQQVSTIQSYYFHEFMYVLEQLENQNRDIIIDLLTCDFDVEYIKEIQQHFQHLQIRVSTNDTGNPEYGGDWIMEYNSFDDDTSINIRDVFFTANIRNFTVILNANHHHFIRSNNISNGSNINQTLRYSPDGNRIAVIDDDNKIIYIYTNELILEISYTFNTIKLIPDQVYTLEWNPTDNNNIVFNVGTHIVFFDISNPNPNPNPINITTDNIRSLSWSPDASYIATIDLHNVLSIYNISSSQIDSSVNVLSSPQQVEWSPNGNKIAVSDNDGLHIFNKDNITSGADISFALTSIESISWSPDSLYILAVSSSEAYMYDILNGTIHLDIIGINSLDLLSLSLKLFSGAIHPDAYQFTIATNNSFLFFDYTTGKLEAPALSTSAVNNYSNLQYSPDGNFMIYNEGDENFYLMHSLTPSVISIIDTPFNETYSISNFLWYQNHMKLLVGANNTSKSTIFIFDISNVDNLKLEDRIVLNLPDADISFDVDNGANKMFRSLTLSPDETKLAFTFYNSNTAYIYDLSNQTFIQPINDSIQIIYWHLQDNDILYYTTSSNILKRYNITINNTITFSEFKNSISDLEMSPDYSKLAVVGFGIHSDKEKHFFILDSTNLTTISDISGIQNHFYNVSWSPDSTFIASGTDGPLHYNINIIDTNGNIDNSLNGHTNLIRHVNWSSDGQYIVSGQIISNSADPYIHVFNVSSGTIEHSFFGHTSQINIFVFQPNAFQWGQNNDRIASIQDVGTTLQNPLVPNMIRIWEINPAPRTIQQQDPGPDPGPDPGQDPGQQTTVSNAANPRRRILTTNFGINRTQQAMVQTIARRTVSSTPAKRKTGIPSQGGSFSRLDYLRQIAGSRQ